MMLHYLVYETAFRRTGTKILDVAQLRNWWRLS
jgi:hypothetical protein